ncbi:hypothetical protein ACFE04_024858 [Oxalis oulophora]
MWFSFWRSRDRFSLDELRYLTDQLHKIQIVNDVNKDFVVEALRSIAELLTYGDQHDSSFFDFFMERQVMGELVRILKISRTVMISLQLLQTDEVVSFPLYVEAIRFAFHEENMIRTAVRAVALNVYHVGDDGVNKYVTSSPHAEYFSELISFFRKQCIDLSRLLFSKKPCPDFTSTILSAVDEIEDNLFYFSDIISAGIPDVGTLITDSILQKLILPLLLPSLKEDAISEIQIGSVTSLYLLCCIIRIVKIKDLANTVAAALFCPLEAFVSSAGVKLNGFGPGHTTHENQQLDNDPMADVNTGHLRVIVPNPASPSQVNSEDVTTPKKINLDSLHLPLREALLSFITIGDDVQVLGSLNVLATLLQTKELDESMLDALGILPQRKQHKKLLLQALVGEGSGEEQLFSPESCSSNINNGLGYYLQNLKDRYGVLTYFPEVASSPRVHRHQVLDALVCLFCRSNISAETLWDGGWLLRQLLPYSEAEFNSHHLKLLKESYKKSTDALVQEIRGIWPDFLIKILQEEWKKCKRGSYNLLSFDCEFGGYYFTDDDEQKSFYNNVPSGSSLAAAEGMCEVVKVFVLLHQLQIFSLGRPLPEKPAIYPPDDLPERTRARTAGVDISGPKPNMEIRLVDAVACRIAFERGKERHFYFLAISIGTSGWILLAEEVPLKQYLGVPRIDEKHSRWLHLRIRPSTLPFIEPSRKVKTKALVDGRWTLAFRDEETCKSAASMICEETNLQTSELERRLKPLLDLETAASSSYNLIIGQPALWKLCVVLFPYEHQLWITTSEGIVEIRCSEIEHIHMIEEDRSAEHETVACMTMADTTRPETRHLTSVCQNLNAFTWFSLISTNQTHGYTYVPLLVAPFRLHETLSYTPRVSLHTSFCQHITPGRISKIARSLLQLLTFCSFLHSDVRWP